ncbi:MAG: hypothetical protein OJF55_001258 [Rhodanobacteraceae bacterium]|jgi:peptidoglycan/LPS O-acetylase OafA/YrhL|nr:MAG: hypothetical protein OJF55_001258 [Rhodanobacteraceae bacterium]
MSSHVDDVIAAPMETAIVRGTVLTNICAHRNNFDAVRLLAALLVLCSHQLFFLGRSQPEIGGHTLGELAVMMFFVISGYLVAESWYRDPHVVRFLLRRFLRLWPALAVATLVIALASALVTSLSLHDYFRGGGVTWLFVVHNLQLRIVYGLPGVFADGASAARSAVNGSWWTIPVEMKCYLGLALLGLIGLRRRWFSVIALAAVSVLYVQSLPGHPKGNAAHNLRFLYIGFFLTGVCARQFFTNILTHRVAWSGAALALLVGAVVAGRTDAVTWIVLAPLVLIAGSLSVPGVRAAGRFGDLSYGIYVYAYFVQQLSIRYWPGVRFPAATLAVSMIATAALAWCSWHAVEAPALGLKRHLRRWFPDRAA